MTTIIKYNDTDITEQFRSGRWSHPVTGVKYPYNFPPEEIEGVTVEVLPDPAPVLPTPEEIETQKERQRLDDYRNESDPLFFKWQRGEIEQQVWLDKVDEIKARYV